MKYSAYLMIANIFIATTLLVCLDTPQSHAKDEALDLLGYFADMYGGNNDGKFGPEDIGAITSHHLGAAVSVMDLYLSKEVAEKVLKQSRYLAEGEEYKRAYEEEAVGLAIVAKARQLGCLDALRKLKGTEWLSDPVKLARTDMADLGSAFLVGHYSWRIDKVKKVLEQGKLGREGFRIFMAALLSDWSLPYIHNRPFRPKIPQEERVVKKVREVSKGEFTPQVFRFLSDRIPGKTFTEKIGFWVRK